MTSLESGHAISIERAWGEGLRDAGARCLNEPGEGCPARNMDSASDLRPQLLLCQATEILGWSETAAGMVFIWP